MSKLKNYYINYESLDKIQSHLKYYKEYVLCKKSTTILFFKNAGTVAD